MQSTDDLHRLIRSLSANEKRYFKIFSSKQNSKESRNYTALFDALDKMPEYDEDVLKRKLKNSPALKTLPVVKNYLHALIMRSMRLYRTETKIPKIIFNLLQDALIYKEKSLFEMQLKTLKKALNLSEQYDIIYFQFPILFHLKNVELNLSRRNAHDITGEVHEMENNALKKLTVEIAMDHIFYELWSQYKVDPLFNDAGSISKYNELKLSPYMQDYDALETFKAKWHYLRSHSMLCRFNNENKEAITYYKQVLALYDEHQHHKENEQHEYTMALNNYLAALHRAGEYDDFMRIINMLKEIKPATIFEELNVFNFIWNNTLLLALATHQYELKDELISGIRAGLEKFSSVMKEQTKVGLLYNMCAMTFTTSDFSEALDIADEMISMRAESRKDLQYGTQLFRLIIHFELGNHTLLESLIRSTVRSLQNDNVYAAFEKMLTGNLKKLIGNLPEKHKAICSIYYEDLLMLKAANPNYKFVIMTETLAWLQSKINGTDIKTEIVRITAPQPETL